MPTGYFFLLFISWFCFFLCVCMSFHEKHSSSKFWSQINLLWHKSITLLWILVHFFLPGKFINLVWPTSQTNEVFHSSIKKYAFSYFLLGSVWVWFLLTQSELLKHDLLAVFLEQVANRSLETVLSYLWSWDTDERRILPSARRAYCCYWGLQRQKASFFASLQPDWLSPCLACWGMATGMTGLWKQFKCKQCSSG